jgi:hypothetical protein
MDHAKWVEATAAARVTTELGFRVDEGSKNLARKKKKSKPKPFREVRRIQELGK